jgi:hypothetical protein
LEMIVAEERRRTWWAVLNLERLVSLFHTEWACLSVRLVAELSVCSAYIT